MGARRVLSGRAAGGLRLDGSEPHERRRDGSQRVALRQVPSRGHGPRRGLGALRGDDHGRPDLARPLLAGTAALLGFPPFVLFFTEVAIIIAGWTNGLGWAMAAALLLLLVVFAGFARQVAAMTLGVPTGPTPDEAASPAEPAPAAADAGRGRQAPLVAALLAAVLLGFAARPLAELLTDAAAFLAGAR